jgi:predicted DNA-binding protein with PD1-like motif
MATKKSAQAQEVIFDETDWKKRTPRYDVAEARLGRVLTIRMAPGDDLYGTTLKICAERGVKAGVILSVAASLRRATLRNVWQFPNPWPINSDCRIFTPIEGPLELLQMSGNITQTEDGKPYLHAHVTISMGRPEATCFGGHLVEGCTIFSTCEMVLAEIEDLAFMRLLDKQTKVGEVFGIPVNGKSKAEIKKEISRRKARPNPHGKK